MGIKQGVRIKGMESILRKDSSPSYFPQETLNLEGTKAYQIILVDKGDGEGMEEETDKEKRRRGNRERDRGR